MNLQDRRVWYVLGAIVVVLLLGWSLGWFGATPPASPPAPAPNP